MSNQPTQALQAEPPAKRPPRAPWLLGVVGLGLAVAAGVLQACGIVVASGLDWERGTLFAWLAIGASVVAFAVGLAAVVLGRGRRWGVIAMGAAIVANPYLVARILEALG